MVNSLTTLRVCVCVNVSKRDLYNLLVQSVEMKMLM